MGTLYLGSYLFRDPSNQTAGLWVSFTIATNGVFLTEQTIWTILITIDPRMVPGWFVFNSKRYRWTNSLVRQTKEHEAFLSKAMLSDTNSKVLKFMEVNWAHDLF